MNSPKKMWVIPSLLMTADVGNHFFKLLRAGTIHLFCGILFIARFGFITLFNYSSSC